MADADFDFVGDRPDARDTTRGAFRSIFLNITFDMPAQSHEAASHSHANIGFVETGLPGKFVEHFLFQGQIDHHPLQGSQSRDKCPSCLIFGPEAANKIESESTQIGGNYWIAGLPDIDRSILHAVSALNRGREIVSGDIASAIREIDR